MDQVIKDLHDFFRSVSLTYLFSALRAKYVLHPIVTLTVTQHAAY